MYSSDSHLTIPDIARIAQSRGIDAVIITDHDSMEAIRDVKAQNTFYGVKVFVGCEVSSSAGHILAYGISEPPPPKMAPDYTLEFIHEHGGIAVAAHPYRKIGLGVGDLVFDLHFDAIEVMSSSVNKHASKSAIQSAKLLNLPMLAGSDAHRLRLVGSYYTEFDDPIENIDDLIESIKANKVRPVRNNISMKKR